MVSDPRFSVVVPVRDGTAALARALRSIVSQEGPSFEVVVVDDGSREDVGSVVEALGDPRVRWFRQAPSGVSAARNAGAAAARGDYLVFLDADDLALPGWLAGFDEMVDRANCDIALCGAEMVVEPAGVRRHVPPTPRGAPFDFQLGPYLPGMVAIRREVFWEVGGYDERFAYSENTELALRVTNLVRRRGWVVAATDRPLVVRHVRPGNRRYDRARYEASRLLVELHGDRFARSPHALARRLAVLGVDAARIGERTEARRALLRAVRLQPRPRNLARLVRVLGPSGAEVRARLGRLVPPERRVKPLGGARGRRLLQARKLLWPLVRRTVVVTAPSGVRLPITADPVDEQIAHDLLGPRRWVYFPDWPGGSPPAPLVLDVGAHHGLYAVCALGEYPGSRVICVEPSRHAAALAEAALARNGFGDRARVVVAALADTPGRGVLHVAERSWGSSLYEDPDEPTVGTEEVDLVTLAQVLAGERPDIVKCNAEGAEFSLIDQLARSDVRPMLMVVMVHPAFGDLAGLVARACSLGYRAVPVGTEARPAFHFWRADLPVAPEEMVEAGLRAGSRTGA